ncbi:MAG: adhesin, partial [Marinilabiliales bacterium]
MCIATVNAQVVGSVDIQDDVSCNGGSDGSVTLAVTGGTPPYTYQWDDPMSQTTQTASGLMAGTYTVVITDQVLATDSVLVTITEPSVIMVNHMITDDSGSCDGGIDITVSGGTPAYSYIWSNTEMTEDVSSLCSGNYGLTVTDANGCSSEHSYDVMSGGGCGIVANEVMTDESSAGMCDGMIEVHPSGGMPPYTFNWSTASADSMITNLCSGWYDLTITDANACEQYFSFEMKTAGAGGCGIVANEMVYGESSAGMCDGMIEVHPSGGMPPYTFNWSTASADSM